ncbi:hypothetical protein GUI12_04305 [Anaplasmataceae bacterium AB001_6]|nr:hypothetical protein GUI12_04305 [Anaplasmataceae bacterium AB001_6]
MFSDFQILALAFFVAFVICYKPVSRLLKTAVNDYIKDLSFKIRKSFDLLDDSEAILIEKIKKKEKIDLEAEKILDLSKEESEKIFAKFKRDIDDNFLILSNDLKVNKDKYNKELFLQVHFRCLDIAREIVNTSIDDSVCSKSNKIDNFELLEKFVSKKLS